MTTYLFAGGGTAGHVNPLLATADRLVEREPDATVLVLGTSEGLEARLVPERGYELLTIPRLPLPRRPNGDALRFPGRWRQTVAQVRQLLHEHHVDVVVGFGGYASAPAYRAARLEKLPIAIHEQNAKPGFANRLGARWTRFVGIDLRLDASWRIRPWSGSRCATRSRLSTCRPRDRRVARCSASITGCRPSWSRAARPARSASTRACRARSRPPRKRLAGGAHHRLPFAGRRPRLARVPPRRVLRPHGPGAGGRRPGDLACRGGDPGELAALGIPAVLVPYAAGNGEQAYNAQDAVNAGGAILVTDEEFTPEYVQSELPAAAAQSRADRRHGGPNGVGRRARRGRPDGRPRARRRSTARPHSGQVA